MPENQGQAAQTEELKTFIAGILKQQDVDAETKLDEHYSRMESLVKSSVPDGDLIEHRRYHERLVADAADRKAMWKGARDNAVKSGSWIVAVFVATAIWNAAKAYMPGA